jgi:hypothetical protein
MASYSSCKTYQTVAADWSLGSTTFPSGYPILSVVVDRSSDQKKDTVTMMFSSDGNGGAITLGGTASAMTFSESVAGTVAGLFPTWATLPSASTYSGINPNLSTFYLFSNLIQSNNATWPYFTYTSTSNHFSFNVQPAAIGTSNAYVVMFTLPVQ